MIDDLNITGAGSRWISRFLDFIEEYSLPNVEFVLSRNKKLALKGYSCITYKDKWVVAFKITSNQLRVYEIIHGALLK